jgi:hypothetical protein
MTSQMRQPIAATPDKQIDSDLFMSSPSCERAQDRRNASNSRLNRRWQ